MGGVGGEALAGMILGGIAVVLSVIALVLSFLARVP